MGRIIGPRGVNIIRLREESGTEMRSQDDGEGGAIVIKGADMNAVLHGARLVNQQVAKFTQTAKKRYGGDGVDRRDVKVGPASRRPPRHLSCFEPSFLVLNGIL